MALGPGKYDAACTIARESTKAHGVALLVIGGEFGNGFSVEASHGVAAALPTLLRTMADEIERSFAQGNP